MDEKIVKDIQVLAKDLANDAISRQEAIDIVNKYDKSHMILMGKPMLGATSIVIELEDLPSVQPERKRGKWIPVTNGRGGHECSSCHNYAPSFQTGDEWLTDYCPNCGARMEGE